MRRMRTEQPTNNGRALPAPQPQHQWATIREGMKVVARDGRAGRAAFVIRDRQTHEPTHLVVRRGWVRFRLIMLPLSLIAKITGDRIELNVDLQHVRQLPTYRTDTQIADDVWSALARTAPFAQNADFGAIHVDTHQQVVTLHGHVRSTEGKYAATRIAQGVRGVAAVRNNLIADDELCTRVEDTLVSDPVLRAPQVRVEANLGMIHVYAHVRQRADVMRIRQLAGQIPGVERVYVTIQVTEPERPDAIPAWRGKQNTGGASQAGLT
jgi:osmotically-inducible protein OsmY